MATRVTTRHGTRGDRARRSVGTIGALSISLVTSLVAGPAVARVPLATAIGPAAPVTTHAETGDAELDALRRSVAELPPGPEGDAAREPLLLDLARAERRRYDATADAAHLSAAQVALRQHLELAARRGTLTDEHRREVEAELEALDNLAGWETEAPASAAPPIPTVAPPPVVAPPAPAPAPAPPDPTLQRRRKVASGVAIAGSTFLGLGGAAWVFLALPAFIAAEIAQQRADDGTIIVAESELYERAERRRRFARISFWSGLGGVVVGGAMLGAGLGTKAKIEREMSRPRPRVSLHPTLGRTHAGASLVLRY